MRVIGVPQAARLFFCGCFQIGQDRLSVDLTLLNGLGDLAWDLVVIAVGGWRRLVSAHLIAGVWSFIAAQRREEESGLMRGRPSLLMFLPRNTLHLVDSRQ